MLLLKLLTKIVKIRKAKKIKNSILDDDVTQKDTKTDEMMTRSLDM